MWLSIIIFLVGCVFLYQLYFDIKIKDYILIGIDIIGISLAMVGIFL